MQGVGSLRERGDKEEGVIECREQVVLEADVGAG